MNHIRSRFRELTSHLKNKSSSIGVSPENFRVKTSCMQLAQGGHNETENGWHLADLRYRGILSIDCVPPQSLLTLLMHCRAWLDENDGTRGRYHLDDPLVEIQPLDASDSVCLVISLDFVDPVHVSEAENGEIFWNSRNYAPVDYDLWIAERGSVHGASTDV